MGPTIAYSPDSTVVIAHFNGDRNNRQDDHGIIYKYDYVNRRIKWRKRLGKGSPRNLYVNESGRIFFQLVDEASYSLDIIAMDDSLITSRLPTMDTAGYFVGFYLDGFTRYDDSTTIAYGQTLLPTQRYATWLFIKGMGKEYNPITISPSVWRSSAAGVGRLSFYPNPAHDQIRLNVSEDDPLASLSCYDSQGREVWTRHADGPAGLPLHQPLALPPGIYHLRGHTTRHKVLNGRVVVR